MTATRRICLIHWTALTDGARSILAVYEIPADKPSYVWWRRYVRETLRDGETLEVSNPF
jgi:hypothetical protein